MRGVWSASRAGGRKECRSAPGCRKERVMSLAPWGKTEEARSLGEQEKVPELGGEVGCQRWLLSKLKAHQDFGPLTSAPQTCGAQVGVGESPGLWGFLVTDRLCPVSPRFYHVAIQYYAQAHWEWTRIFLRPGRPELSETSYFKGSSICHSSC